LHPSCGSNGISLRQIAITGASVTSCAVIAALIDQPTTRREKRSMTRGMHKGYVKARKVPFKRYAYYA
jgi:hypothetical protein